MNSFDEKEQRILKLFYSWRGCTKCELGKLRDETYRETAGDSGNIVFGDGNVDADLLVIGIGPGVEEDRTGIPFHGDSGDVLNQYLERLQLSRDEIFMTNIVSCRPFTRTKDERSGRYRSENRDPTPTECAACRSLWQQTLYIIDPLMVVVLGKPAIREVTTSRSVSMFDVQSSLSVCEIPGRVAPVRYPSMQLFHPAYLLRSGHVYKGGPWHKTLIGWQRAVHLLDQLRSLHRGVPIPDRGYKEDDLFLQPGEDT